MKTPSLPADRRYDRRTHLWVQEDTAAPHLTVGIDALGLESLGELAYISIVPVGTTVARGEAVGTLEAAKMTSSLLAPVSGTVVELNEAVLADALRVNEDPYGAGWLFRMEPADRDADWADLLHGDALVEWAEAETRRLEAE